MVNRRTATIVLAGVVVLNSPFVCHLSAQGTRNTTSKRDDEPKKKPPTNLTETQLPAFAISLVISLATDARSYSDLALRPRVLARAADVLWDVDNVNARELFKRAWEAAEKGDAEEVTIKKDDPPAMAMALRRMSGRDLRFEVLNLMALRDRALSEEYFAKVKSENEREQEGSKSKIPDDGWFVSEAISKRLQVASALLKEGQPAKALEFAAPALNQVNVHTIGFLSELRAKNAEAADRTFAMLLARAEFDPAADANTVSGLSSYVFTPGLYLTFKPEGAPRWTQPDEPSVAPTNLPDNLRDKFFQVGARILLRPLSPNDNIGSNSRTVKYNVIKRLLPLFDQYAPDTATALRSQLMELSGGTFRDTSSTDSFLSTQGIKPEMSAGDALEQMQSRLDHATTSRERDAIYAAAAGTLLAQGDMRARDLADKIDNPERRNQIRQLVDFGFVQQATRKKSLAEVIRLAQTGQLTHAQRASAYTEAARLSLDAKSQQALELLEKAIQEAQRIEAGKPDRALLLIGIASQLIRVDRIRAWEVMGDAVTAANVAEGFTGDNVLQFPLVTRSGMQFMQIGGENFSLSNVFRSLAKDDLYRALDLAKTFKFDTPRATVTLAIARAILEKQRQDLQN